MEEKRQKTITSAASSAAHLKYTLKTQLKKLTGQVKILQYDITYIIIIRNTS